MFDLNYVRIFERVAALSSFSGAARELQLPRSNVSRAVSKLEEELGTRLVHRTTREVVLTAAGTALFERTRSLMADLAEAVDYMAELSGKPSGPLRISAGIGLGIMVLGKHLPKFIARYPEIQIEIYLESTRVDLVSQKMDAAIRFGALPDSSMVARTLGSVPRILCASPEYVSAQTSPTRPEELAKHPFIDFPAYDGRPRRWRLKRDVEQQDVFLLPRVVVNDVLTIHQLVLGGAGIGVVPRYLCETDLLQGKLVEVLPDWQMEAVPVSLLFPSRRELAPSVRALSDFLNEIGPFTPWGGSGNTGEA